MPTKKRTEQQYICPCCKGIGLLSEKERGLVAWMFECAEWMLKFQKRMETAQVDEREIFAAHEAYLAALIEPEEAWKK
jgi:hypothetical protein